MADSGIARTSNARIRHAHSTFMVEAMLILACLLVVLAVCMSLFAFANQTGARTEAEQQAIALAQGTAERFAADPSSVELLEESDGFQVNTQIDRQPQGAGVMVFATISVLRDGEQLFQMDTARYVSGATATGGI